MQMLLVAGESMGEDAKFAIVTLPLTTSFYRARASAFDRSAHILISIAQCYASPIPLEPGHGPIHAASDAAISFADQLVDTLLDALGSGHELS
ncbi:hypothetical protein AC579_5240 [Pseudocercospora musae]|uniref:Uncharacterized protein n=1 Tax=Pseudocercospora musae TaxID=113226 RepID=A0A139IPM3_9PEZI|nr:hypothetical protein AC579_5240 [Pseudocercospora musae]